MARVHLGFQSSGPSLTSSVSLYPHPSLQLAVHPGLTIFARMSFLLPLLEMWAGPCVTIPFSFFFCQVAGVLFFFLVDRAIPVELTSHLPL